MSEHQELEHKGNPIRAEMRTTATPEQVWEAWTDPEKFTHWFVDKAMGEPKVGSTMTWIFERFNYVLPQEVIRAVPPEHFALLGRMEGREPGILEIIIRREGGETVVRLINSGFIDTGVWEDEYQGVVSGWQLSLTTLKHYLENYPGRARSSFQVFRPAAFEYEQLLPFYRTQEGLSRWLTSSGHVGERGERYEFVLRDGRRMTGRVLTLTRREVLLSWDEIDGAIALKAFCAGPGARMLGIHGSSWRLNPEEAAEVEASFHEPVDRLAQIVQDRDACSASLGESM